jgi:hypothetical protein
MGMNPFESTLVSALHDEATEIAMSADLNESREILDHRLDHVDRGRRRWQVAGGLVAAAAAVAAIAFFAVGRPAAAPQPTDPSPSASALTGGPHTSVAFVPTVSWNPPGWTTTQSIQTSERTDHATWETSGECGQRCAGAGFVNVRTVKEYPSGQVISVQKSADYLAYLRTLEAAGILTLSKARAASVGGLSGTAFTSVERLSREDVFGCAGDDGVSDCYGTDAGWTTTVVVLDNRGQTMVVVAGTPTDNPDRALYEAQFQAALDTVRFGSS